MTAALLVVAALVQGINMFHFPYVEDDEGTYMSQAWAVLHLGSLQPYTYWYDHAPLGWIQIALWTELTGGFHKFGLTYQSGRVMMLVLQVGSTWMLYVIAHRLSHSRTAAVVAALLFALSPFGIYFHRRVLLDNICTFWMLVSLLLLLSPHLTLKRVWLSGLALGISILSKELTVFLAPVMAYIAYYRTDRIHRAFAMTGWIAIVTSMLSMYVVMAALKGELFPTGTSLGGHDPHVSLLGTLMYQASRGKDGGILDLQSTFWHWFRSWVQSEPTLLVGGGACMLANAVSIVWRRMIGLIGLLTISFIVFLVRGGEVIEFYLVPYLPLLALNIGLVAGSIIEACRRWASPLVSTVASAVLLVACVGQIARGYTVAWQGLAADHFLLRTGTQADAQVNAENWVRAHVPATKSIVMDNYMWTDLHDGYRGDRVFRRADWYWKLSGDPAIRDTVYHNTWRRVNYVVTTVQLHMDAQVTRMVLLERALAHATLLAHFDTGGWPVDVWRVVQPGERMPPKRFPVPAQANATDLRFVGYGDTRREGTTILLDNRTVQPAAAVLTFSSCSGNRTARAVGVDPSSALRVGLTGIVPPGQPFRLHVVADRPLHVRLDVTRNGGRPTAGICAARRDGRYGRARKVRGGSVRDAVRPCEATVEKLGPSVQHARRPGRNSPGMTAPVGVCS